MITHKAVLLWPGLEFTLGVHSMHMGIQRKVEKGEKNYSGKLIEKSPAAKIAINSRLQTV